MQKRTYEDLKLLQNLPLRSKIMKTKQRIREFIDRYGEENIYVSFSGGKDSTVLRHIVMEEYPEIPSIYVDTGLEYPEVRQFVKKQEGNIQIIRSDISFIDVVRKFGYPFISKEVSRALYYAKKAIKKGNINNTYVQRLEGTYKSGYNHKKYKDMLYLNINFSDQCCDVLKKRPFSKIKKFPIIGSMAEESSIRRSNWYTFGCNIYSDKKPKSLPISFWTEQDIFEYILKYNLKIPSVYGKIENVPKDKNGQFNFDDLICPKYHTSGTDRTGCIFCGFGSHLSKSKKFVKLKETHPKQYEWCMKGGEFNENGIWVPNKNGLGLQYVIDQINKIYGEHFIEY